MRNFIACLLALAVIATVYADAKEDLARADIRNLTKAAEAYQKAKGVVPEKLVDLQTAGYVDPKHPLTDPWGKRYQYDPKGKRNKGKKPDIWTEVPDKKEIGNWQPEKK